MEKILFARFSVNFGDTITCIFKKLIIDCWETMVIEGFEALKLLR